VVIFIVVIICLGKIGLLPLLFVLYVYERKKIEEKYSRSYSSGKLNHEINKIRTCYEMTPHRSRREKRNLRKRKKDRTRYAWDMEIKNGLGGLYSGAD
jgi:hypothetical protein